MTVYLLFSPREEEHICTFIYTKEDGKIISYSFDEEYIVKTDETAIKDFRQLEDAYPAKAKVKKGKKPEDNPVLIKRDFPDVKAALYFLEGTLTDYQENIPAHKKLPQIINPYDLDLDENEMKATEIEFDSEVDEDELFSDLGTEEDDENFDNYDDDLYR